MTEKTKTSFTENQWAALCHISALCGFIVPLGNIIVPSILWIVKKSESQLIDDNGRDALNFQLTIFATFLILLPLLAYYFVGALLLLALALFQVINVIRATVATDNNEPFKYPFAIKFVRPKA